MDGGHGNTDLSMNWDLHYPELGNTVEIITQYMRVVVWLNQESFLEDVSPNSGTSSYSSAYLERALHATTGTTQAQR